jgi:hypothetical protein
MPLPHRSPFDRPRWTERDACAALAALERSGKPVRLVTHLKQRGQNAAPTSVDDARSAA